MSDPQTSETPRVDPAALERLVRAAMASGAACFVERVGRGEVDMSAPLSEALGDFPVEFLRLRGDLVRDLTDVAR